MSSQLSPGQSLTPGGMKLVNGHYQMIMQSNGLLTIEDTNTNPATVVFCSPNQPLSPTTNNVEAIISGTTGYLQIIQNPTTNPLLLWSSANNATSTTACLNLSSGGVATIYSNCSAQTGPMWNSTQACCPQVNNASVVADLIVHTANEVRSLGADFQRLSDSVAMLEKAARILFPVPGGARDGGFGPSEAGSGIHGSVPNEKVG